MYIIINPSLFLYGKLYHKLKTLQVFFAKFMIFLAKFYPFRLHNLNILLKHHVYKPFIIARNDPFCVIM